MLWNSETAIHFSHFTANYEIEKKMHLNKFAQQEEKSCILKDD